MRLANMNLMLFVGNHCQRESTLTIVSSECSRPLSGVTLYSRSYMVVVSSYNGRFRIRACRLPLYVTLKKYGYRTMRVIVRRPTETFKMRCLGMFYHRMLPYWGGLDFSCSPYSFHSEQKSSPLERLCWRTP